MNSLVYIMKGFGAYSPFALLIVAIIHINILVRSSLISPLRHLEASFGASKQWFTKAPLERHHNNNKPSEARTAGRDDNTAFLSLDLLSKHRPCGSLCPH